MTEEHKDDQVLADELKGFFDPNDTRHNAQQPFDESYQALWLSAEDAGGYHQRADLIFYQYFL